MAAPCGQSQYSVEVHFAQRLASNEKKIRDRAVKRLRHWIAARSQKDGNISDVELMKLWKGLFYCMWMCDKPVIQEELADQISDMAHCFRRPQEACLFFETFLATMRREWIGIDHLRMDKYLMLIRRSFRQMLVVLHNNEWEEELLKTFLTTLSQCVLNPETDACPDGLRYQLANVYLDELAREGTEDLSPQQASTFLFPFAELAAKTLNKKLRDVILQDIFQDVVERSDVGEKEEEEEEDEGIASDEDRKKTSKNGALKEKRKKRRGKVDEEEEEDDEDDEEDEDDVDILEKVMFPEEMVPPLQYDYGMIADKLFDLASEKTIPPRNRKPIYKMVKRFQSLSKGVYPMPDLLKQIREEKDNDYLKDELPWWKKLQEKEKKKKRRRKRRRGKKDKMNEDREDDDGDDEEPNDEGKEEEEEEEVVPKKKKKVQKEDIGKTETVNKMKKKKKQKKLTETDEHPEKETTRKDSVEQTTHIDNEFTELKSVARKGKKKKGKQSRDGDDEALAEEPVESETLSTEESITVEAVPSPEDASKRKKKRKKGASKPDAENSKLSEEPKNNTDTDSGLTVSKAKGEMVGDSLLIEGAAHSISQMPKTKSNKKKGKKKSAASDNTDDTNGMNFNTVTDDVSRGGSEVQSPQKGSPKPFAAFQKVSTPVAFVKKSKTVSEPSTLPRAKAQSRVETKFSPPMTRKRVKIALSKNQFQAANDYKQRIKLSPGVPFDGSKKPAFSVLKQTPPRSEVTKPEVKGSSKKSGKVEKKRARATDFF